jgi:hypothetical protein
MNQENIAGPDQKQAASPVAAMFEAEDREKAKAELSDLFDQIDQTKAEAHQARALIKCLGDKARRAVADYRVEADLMEAQAALKKADAWVEASLVSLDKPDDRDKPRRGDTPVSAALMTLHRAAQQLRCPGVDVVRMEMKIFELAEVFDIADEIARNGRLAIRPFR